MTIDELKNYIDERTHDSETKILTELRKYSLLFQSLLKVQRAKVDGVEERLTLIEERLSDLESK
jgi:polyhydroxyalkanoate synthesis regulator phasin